MRCKKWAEEGRSTPLKSHSFIIEVSGINLFSSTNRAPRYREAVLFKHIHINVNIYIYINMLKNRLRMPLKICKSCVNAIWDFNKILNYIICAFYFLSYSNLIKKNLLILLFPSYEIFKCILIINALLVEIICLFNNMINKFQDVLRYITRKLSRGCSWYV